MNIRLGTKTDVKTIGPFLKEMWLDHVKNEPKFLNSQIIEKSDLKSYFKNCFNKSNKSFVFIAEEKDETIGILKVNIEKIQRFFNQTKILYIDDIYVIKTKRKNGIAKTLIREAEKLAIKKKIRWIKCRVYDFNKNAQNLFKSQGFNNLYSEYFKIL